MSQFSNMRFLEFNTYKLKYKICDFIYYKCNYILKWQICLILNDILVNCTMLSHIN